jgi:hypothetical protein
MFYRPDVTTGLIAGFLRIVFVPLFAGKQNK